MTHCGNGSVNRNTHDAERNKTVIKIIHFQPLVSFFGTLSKNKRNDIIVGLN